MTGRHLSKLQLLITKTGSLWAKRSHSGWLVCLLGLAGTLEQLEMESGKGKVYQGAGGEDSTGLDETCH